MLAALTSGLPRDSSATPPALENLFAGSFNLVDHDGQPRSDKDFRGRYMLVFFGYSFCPDVCPTTMAEVAAVLDRLGPLSDRLNPIFITIDPARDSVDVLQDYVPAFHPAITGLTGSPAQIAEVARKFLAAEMEKFLFGGGAEKPAGFVAPEDG